jgi:uncharacterized membrane protein YeiH
MLLTSLDLCGTFLFALSGAAMAAERRLDLFGILMLAFAASVSGGIIRDVLLGITPPAAIADWRYLAVAAFAGVVAFLRPGWIAAVSGPVAVFDALGLGFFAVNGALKALNAGLNPLMAAVLGMITAIGGGIARDILTIRIPMVLQSEIYAVAALVSAAIAAFGLYFELPFWPVVITAGVLGTSLRLAAYYRGWHLPKARLPETRSGKPPGTPDERE